MPEYRGLMPKEEDLRAPHRRQAAQGAAATLTQAMSGELDDSSIREKLEILRSTRQLRREREGQLSNTLRDLFRDREAPAEELYEAYRYGRMPTEERDRRARLVKVFEKDEAATKKADKEGRVLWQAPASLSPEDRRAAVATQKALRGMKAPFRKRGMGFEEYMARETGKAKLRVKYPTAKKGKLFGEVVLDNVAALNRTISAAKEGGEHVEPLTLSETRALALMQAGRSMSGYDPVLTTFVRNMDLGNQYGKVAVVKLMKKKIDSGQLTVKPHTMELIQLLDGLRDSGFFTKEYLDIAGAP
jgi:hypothetical protein